MWPPPPPPPALCLQFGRSWGSQAEEQNPLTTQDGQVPCPKGLVRHLRSKKAVSLSPIRFRVDFVYWRAVPQSVRKI